MMRIAVAALCVILTVQARAAEKLPILFDTDLGTNIEPIAGGLSTCCGRVWEACG